MARYFYLHGRRVSISRLTNKPPKGLRSVACGVYIPSCHVVSNSCGRSASLSCSTCYLVRVTRFVLTITYLLFWLRALIHNNTVCSISDTYDIGTFLWQHVSFFLQAIFRPTYTVNPLNPELNPICYLPALLGAHHFLHVSRIRVKLLTLRRLIYIYIYIWSTHS